MTYQVLIVEDHPAMSLAFRTLIDKQPNLSVCGQARTVKEMDEMLQKLLPDVILVDIYLPEDSDSPVQYDAINQRGLSAGLSLKSAHPEIGVLFTSALLALPIVNIILDSEHRGGLGFITKDADPDEIAFALMQVAQGERHVDFQTSRRLLRPKPNLEHRLRKIFTNRETEVLVLVAEGYSREQISQGLGISSGRVDRTLEQLRQKLRDYGVSTGNSTDYTFVHLAHLAISIGLVSVLPVRILDTREKELPTDGPVTNE